MPKSRYTPSSIAGADTATGKLLVEFAATMELGALLLHLDAIEAPYAMLEHWQQGEFHHDVVLRFERPPTGLGGHVLVVSTNCNGGIKEIALYDAVPELSALWHQRCPDSPDFAGALPPLLGRVRTSHWFEPCRLLSETARSEYRPEHRRRQAGGGWEETPGAGGAAAKS